MNDLIPGGRPPFNIRMICVAWMAVAVGLALVLVEVFTK